MSFHGGFRGGFTRGFQSLEREQEREQEEQERTRRERERKEMFFGYPQARERFEEWRRRELERLEREREEERRERPRRKRSQLKPIRLTRKLLDQRREQRLQQAQALKELTSRPPVAIRPAGNAATEEEEFRPWRLRYPGYRPVSPEADEYFPECFALDLTPEIQAQLGLNWMDRVPDHQWISTGELMRRLEWSQQWKWKRSS